MLSKAHKTIKKSGGFVVAKNAAAQPNCHKKTVYQVQQLQQQHSSSGKMAAALQALAFEPVFTVHVRVARTQQQEVEPRQHEHVQRNNGDTSADLLSIDYSSTKTSTIAQICTRHWNACVPPFRLASLPVGYPINPIPKESLVQVPGFKFKVSGYYDLIGSRNGKTAQLNSVR